MIEADVLAFIRREIARQMNVILPGQSADNDQYSESINNLFPGHPTIPARPVMHPYGLVSRAPTGTFQVVGRQGEHIGNRIVLGHRDQNRPVIDQGSTMLYNQFGRAIYLQQNAVRIGSSTAANPAVTGTELKSLLQSLITLISTHTHVGNLGAPTTAPVEALQFTNLKTQNVDNDKILSQLVFLLKGVS